jgi:hypothetical protein
VIVCSTRCTHYEAGSQLNANRFVLVRMRSPFQSRILGKAVTARRVEQRQEQFEALRAHLIIGLTNCCQRWANMYGGCVIVKSHQRYVLRDSYPILFSGNQYAICHFVSGSENSGWTLLGGGNN